MLCDPLTLDMCGEGHCATEAKDGFAILAINRSTSSANLLDLKTLKIIDNDIEDSKLEVRL